MKLLWQVVLLALVVAMPLLLLGAAVQAIMTPAFLQVEYRMPGFPADLYGFTTAERLQWGTYGIDYLRNNAGIDFLGNLRVADGRPLFNERELSHMLDVKNVVQQLFGFWYWIVLAFGLVAATALLTRQWQAFRITLFRGAMLTFIVAGTGAAIAILGVLGSGEMFWSFFSGFHAMFFSGDSWLFEYSDTLIRLYPIRFWEDAVLWLGVLIAIGASLMLRLGTNRRPRGGPNV